MPGDTHLYNLWSEVVGESPDERCFRVVSPRVTLLAGTGQTLPELFDKFLQDMVRYFEERQMPQPWPSRLQRLRCEFFLPTLRNTGPQNYRSVAVTAADVPLADVPVWLREQAPQLIKDACEAGIPLAEVLAACEEQRLQ